MLTPVFQTLDDAISWINLYPKDNAISFLILTCISWIVIYPVGSTIHGLNIWELVNSPTQDQALAYCSTDSGTQLIKLTR